jgi:class 3 adenylate cyclase
VLVTLLLVEPAEAAERAATLGDQRRHRALNEFQAAARQALTVFRGRELRLAGRRLLATFDGPARAIRGACAIVTAAGSLDLQVRAGLHTGECELLEQQVRGVAFDIAEQVTRHAGGGEVLVSGTVKDLVAGSGLRFHDLGSYSLDGISGDWRLFRVASEPSPGRQA